MIRQVGRLFCRTINTSTAAAMHPVSLSSFKSKKTRHTISLLLIVLLVLLPVCLQSVIVALPLLKVSLGNRELDPSDAGDELQLLRVEFHLNKPVVPIGDVRHARACGEGRDCILQFVHHRLRLHCVHDGEQLVAGVALVGLALPAAEPPQASEVVIFVACDLKKSDWILLGEVSEENHVVSFHFLVEGGLHDTSLQSLLQAIIILNGNAHEAAERQFLLRHF
mmetsp:Transcript_19504/g.39259  ORF Transcript_19504/g.39259 Transcript_19504/m.39259 type:complete len:223 (+) Transcript_19504:668-1336(+)